MKSLKLVTNETVIIKSSNRRRKVHFSNGFFTIPMMNKTASRNIENVHQLRLHSPAFHDSGSITMKLDGPLVVGQQQQKKNNEMLHDLKM